MKTVHTLGPLLGRPGGDCLNASIATPFLSKQSLPAPPKTLCKVRVVLLTGVAPLWGVGGGDTCGADWAGPGT